VRNFSYFPLLYFTDFFVFREFFEGGSENFKKKQEFFYQKLLSKHGSKFGCTELKIDRHNLLESVSFDSYLSLTLSALFFTSDTSINTSTRNICVSYVNVWDGAGIISYYTTADMR
jgi:hypothetical protein